MCKYTKFRHDFSRVLNSYETLIQFEYSAFEEATVPICTFALRNRKINKNGCYFRLTDFRGGMEVQREKTLEAIENHKCGFYFESNSDNFSKIPGAPVAYWVSENFVRAFENPRLGDEVFPKTGFTTGGNDDYLRLWFEVNNKKISRKWFYLNKGGSYKKWYGNNEYVVNWENNGSAIKANKGSTIRNPEFYFKEGVTWSKISSYKFSGRYSPETHIFDAVGLTCFTNDYVDLKYILAYFCSNVATYFLEVLNPTLSYTTGSIANLPFYYSMELPDKINIYVDENIVISKDDWDSFETSWDFKRHPLI